MLRLPIAGRRPIMGSHERAPMMQIRYVFFDLDNTLYPRSCGLFDLIEDRVKEYIRMRLGLSEEEAIALRRRYLEEYGFTLCGLMDQHGVDPEEYLSYVHEVDVEGVLSEDQVLVDLLERITVPKIIVTNATVRHAQRVTRALGIEPYFHRIYDIAFMNYRPKPDPSSLMQVLRHLGAKGEECVMLDDYPPTVAAARRLGIVALSVGADGILGLSDALAGLGLFEQEVFHDRKEV